MDLITIIAMVGGFVYALEKACELIAQGCVWFLAWIGYCPPKKGANT